MLQIFSGTELDSQTLLAVSTALVFVISAYAVLFIMGKGGYDDQLRKIEAARMERRRQTNARRATRVRYLG
jgi:hypothetical protein